MGRHLSPVYGQAILVSRYTVFTAVNWSQHGWSHGCTIPGCSLPNYIESVRLNIGMSVVRMVRRSVYGHVIAKFSRMDRARDQIKYYWTNYSQVMTASGCSSLTDVNWPSLEGRIFEQNGLSTVSVSKTFSPACSGEMPDRVPEPTLLVFW